MAQTRASEWRSHKRSLTEVLRYYSDAGYKSHGNGQGSECYQLPVTSSPRRARLGPSLSGESVFSNLFRALFDQFRRALLNQFAGDFCSEVAGVLAGGVEVFVSESIAADRHPGRGFQLH